LVGKDPPRRISLLPGVRSLFSSGSRPASARQVALVKIFFYFYFFIFFLEKIYFLFIFFIFFIKYIFFLFFFIGEIYIFDFWGMPYRGFDDVVTKNIEFCES
jgi:hypothetical protein